MDVSRPHSKSPQNFKGKRKLSIEINKKEKTKRNKDVTEHIHPDAFKHKQLPHDNQMGLVGQHQWTHTQPCAHFTASDTRNDSDMDATNITGKKFNREQKHRKHTNKHDKSVEPSGIHRPHTSTHVDLVDRGTGDRLVEKKMKTVRGMTRGQSPEDSELEVDSAEEGREDEGREDDEVAAIKKEMADIPLEDLVKIKEKLGLKAFTNILHGEKSKVKERTNFKRANKNRPMEMSSKRPVPIGSYSGVPKKKVNRDPRFDDLSGEYKEEHFSRNYSFISDIKTREKQVLQTELKTCKNEAKVKKLRYLLERMGQQEQAAQRREERREVEASWRDHEKALVQEGKTPYFLKKADKRKLELASKFRVLEKSGKMDNYLSKRRKKSAQKQRRKLPGKHD